MSRVLVTGAIAISAMGHEFLTSKEYCLKPCHTEARYPTPGKRRKFSKRKKSKK